MRYFSAHINRFISKSIVFFIAVLLCLGFNADAQESVFSLFTKDLDTADDYYVNGNYKSALDLYEVVASKKSAPANIDLRLARCYYFTHDYAKAVTSYEKFMKVEKLSDMDQFYYAEALTATGDYTKSAEVYAMSYAKDSQNEMLAARIWRMNNIAYLFEDSVDNAVRYISLNTPNSELKALPYNDGVVYVSNQQPVSMVQKVDTKTNAPFYHLYYSDTKPDPFSVNALIYDQAESFDSDLNGGFHIGSLDFYNGHSKMVVAMTSKYKNEQDKYPLQLYFAAKKKKRWKVVKPFEHNNNGYSLSEPSISEDGKKLYFSSNLPEGYGGRDIYVSNYKDGAWTAPENLGPAVNTSADEIFPFSGSDQTLYFSSNGHPGLGGSDIFKVELLTDGFGEVENLGYPINSGYDDFAFTIDSLNRHGFLSSNRKNGGLDDDIYEFDMGLQSYPLKIDGVVKFIEHNWMDSTDLKPLPNVQLILIDDNGNNRVTEAISDDNGNFSFTIPFYSKYKIRIVGNDLDGIVSFEVPKYAKTNSTYEIVVVNDDFKKSKEGVK
ncbi:MAG: hypothetical protein RIB54_02445 [Fulvivirga sp.]|uniref:hypothetical protein n=1 Tax=Fulvivirga sp. TaxID=1931237 RepID=UPI0032EDDC26